MMLAIIWTSGILRIVLVIWQVSTLCMAPASWAAEVGVAANGTYNWTLEFQCKTPVSNKALVLEQPSLNHMSYGQNS